MYQDEDRNYPTPQPSENENNEHSYEDPGQFPWNYTASCRPVTPKREKKAWSAGKVVLLALCCSLLGGVLGLGGAILGNRLMQDKGGIFNNPGSTVIQEGVREDTVIDINKIDTDKLMTAAEVYAKNVNSTVGITTSISTNFWGYQTTSAASGSGFILTSDGYVVTNCHVIEGATAISLRFTDGRVLPAQIVGSDAVSDLAVLVVAATDLTPATFGDSSALRVGDTVVAIGDPLGQELRGTMTDGIISAINREVKVGSRTMTLIQTNAALNSGNSGGPLINCHGQVIGINTMKISAFANTSGVEGLGFAIPSATVKEIVDQLVAQGYVSGRPDPGITGEDVPELYQRYYRLPAGFFVTQVESGSSAEAAGLTAGCVITHIGNTRVRTAEEFYEALYAYNAGDTVALTVYRQGKTALINLTLGEAGE